MRAVGLLVAVLFVVAPARVLAGNDDELPIGAEASMTGGAVTATIDSGPALYYAPAGLASVRENTLDASATALTLRRYLAPGIIETVNGASDDAAITEFVTVATSLVYVRNATERTRIAVGVFTPSASELTLRGRVEDSDGINDSRWLLVATESEKRYELIIGAAYAITSRLRVGGSFGGTYGGNRSIVQLFGTGGPTGTPSPEILLATASYRTSSFFGARFAISVQANPSDMVALGLTIRTPGLTFASLLSESSAGVFTLPGAPPVELESTHSDDYGWHADVYAPLEVRGGVAVRFEHGFLALDGSFYAPLAAAPAIQQDERRAGFNARIGGEIYVSDAIRVGAGAFTDRNASVRVARTGATHQDFYGGSFGLIYEKMRRLARSEDVERMHFTTSMAVRYAYGFGDTTQLYVDGYGGEMGADVNSIAFRTHDISFMIASGLRY